MAGVDGLVDQAIQLAQVSGMSFSEALTGLRAATDLSEASVERARAVQAESELKDAKERLRRVEAFAQNHAITSHACGRSDREWLDLLAIIEGGN